tara:strand:- start:368 stop:613 length:246 start_codon:yes stop_codon:yes gene_type:complete
MQITLEKQISIEELQKAKWRTKLRLWDEVVHELEKALKENHSLYMMGKQLAEESGMQFPPMSVPEGDKEGEEAKTKTKIGF